MPPTRRCWHPSGHTRLICNQDTDIKCCLTKTKSPSSSREEPHDLRLRFGWRTAYKTWATVTGNIYTSPAAKALTWGVQKNSAGTLKAWHVFSKILKLSQCKHLTIGDICQHKIKFQSSGECLISAHKFDPPSVSFTTKNALNLKEV